VTFGNRFLVSLCCALALAGTVASASEYIVVDNQTGHVLAASDKDAKVQVGSLTKVAAALVVLDWLSVTKTDAGTMVTVPSEAIEAGGINRVGLQPGDEISIRDLLYASLMASDNTAASVLAQYVGGHLPNRSGLPPEGNFVSQMNALAKTLEMKRTRFLNPHGLDNIEGGLPFSTAADMARLTRYAYLKPSFTFYVSQKSRDIHVMRGGVDNTISLANTNELLDQEGIDGVKTGKTERAGECVILSSDRSPEVARNGPQVSVTPRRIIVVLLGSSNRFPEGLGLIRSGWNLYDAWAAAGRKMSERTAL